MIRCAACGRRLPEEAPRCPTHGREEAAPPPPARAAPPSDVPGFILEGIAGHGGFASVLRARRTEDGRPVALKIAHDPSGASARILSHEAAALAAIGAEAAPALLGEGRLPDGRPFLTLELLQAPSLAALMAASPSRWPLDRFLDVARAIAATLARVHARGWVHRDVKPENVFVREPEPKEVRLVDFGLARRAGDPSTAGTAGVGTAPYAAPEQETGRVATDPRVDVYALGVVFHELLLGVPPLWAPRDAEDAALPLPLPLPRRRGGREGPTGMEPARERRRAPLHLEQRGLPRELEALVFRCLATDPAARPPDAGAVLDALAERRPRDAGGAEASRPRALRGATARRRASGGDGPGSDGGAIEPPPAREPNDSLPLHGLSADGATRERRLAGLIALEASAALELAAIQRLTGAAIAELHPARGLVLALLAAPGVDPVIRAVEAARALLDEGLAARAIVDARTVYAWSGRDGATRVFRPNVADAAGHPTNRDPRGLLLTDTARQRLGAAARPVPGRSALFAIEASSLIGRREPFSSE